MSTSIITAPTFTIATTFDVVSVPRSSTTPALAESPVARTRELEQEIAEREITSCDLAAFPRCEWSQRTRCTRHDACQSAK
jgi:hypothetical protein